MDLREVFSPVLSDPRFIMKRSGPIPTQAGNLSPNFVFLECSRLKDSNTHAYAICMYPHPHPHPSRDIFAQKSPVFESCDGKNKCSRTHTVSSRNSSALLDMGSGKRTEAVYSLNTSRHVIDVVVCVFCIYLPALAHVRV